MFSVFYFENKCEMLIRFGLIPSHIGVSLMFGYHTANRCFPDDGSQSLVQWCEVRYPCAPTSGTYAPSINGNAPSGTNYEGCPLF